MPFDTYSPTYGQMFSTWTVKELRDALAGLDENLPVAATIQVSGEQHLREVYGISVLHRRIPGEPGLIQCALFEFNVE